MRKEYDFSHAKKNPYAARLKRQITIRLEDDVIEYFKKMAQHFGMPYQNLINLYLKNCILEHKKPHLKWE